jgi:hypothetical protein
MSNSHRGEEEPCREAERMCAPEWARRWRFWAPVRRHGGTRNGSVSGRGGRREGETEGRRRGYFAGVRKEGGG